MGWGDAFDDGYNQGYARQRQSRLDLLNEAMMRRKMALQDAASARADAMVKERASSAAALRDRMGYLDRMKVLNRDTNPLATLLGKMPGAGAAGNVDEAMRLDEVLARNPEKAAERTPLVQDGQLTGPWAPDQTPTFHEERQRQVTSAYDKFGAEQGKLQRALDAFKLRLSASQHPGSGRPPKVTALDIQYRAAVQKEKLADQLENGVIFDDKGMLRGIMTPEQIPEAKKRAAELRAAANREKELVVQGYRAAGVAAPVLEEQPGSAGPLGVAPSAPPGGSAGRESPSAVAVRLEASGMDADQIAAQLESMFSPEELSAFGQTQE